MINRVNNVTTQAAYMKTNDPKNTEKTQEEKVAAKGQEAQDTVIIGKTDKAEEGLIYKRPVLTKAEATELKANQKSQLLESLVKSLMGSQAGVRAKADKQSLTDDQFATLQKLLGSGETIPTGSVEEAKAAISEGGYWSPESVSDRLVDFAEKISGGDKSKFELMKNAIEDGFKEAEKSWGSKLPQISQDTFDLTMQKLEERFRVEEE